MTLLRLKSFWLAVTASDSLVGGYRPRNGMSE